MVSQGRAESDPEGQDSANELVVAPLTRSRSVGARGKTESGVPAAAAFAEARSRKVADMVDTIEVARKCRRLHTDLFVPSLDDAIPRPPLFCVCFVPALGRRCVERKFSERPAARRSSCNTELCASGHVRLIGDCLTRTRAARISMVGIVDGGAVDRRQ